MKKFISENRFEVYLAVVILLGIILRLYNLDIRPYHHDESIHAMYGQYIYNDPTNGFYKYNPMLHGPFLYNVLPFAYQIFGLSDWAARLLPCLLGIAMIFWPLKILFSLLILNLA